MSRMLWNERYTKGLPSLDIPDPYFIGMYEQFPAGGRALDLAAGSGRHTLYLAERGWEVTAVDFSDVAMEQLSLRAEGLKVKTVCADLSAFEIADKYDLIVLYYYFDVAIFPAIIDALKPGGVLILKLAIERADNENILPLLNELESLNYSQRPVKHRGVAEGLFKKI
ncbi:bifunctional 2-polyprenyl-6-hydroxyphenol methylase/3-demethylubiquinol 3-O-methyltransferase UbiG [[Flexibacter] sp. ATCC 35208]|uniref:class I SAM-dependent methyltransferase n=1 Tax=[Flexibacter] sp. ATCC 35208 TaxID=1936242 RepID=UPI0015C3A149|nr:class I SAM-dependent methyltransferase [[Flexibacter] sp. ATCC 35208]